MIISSEFVQLNVDEIVPQSGALSSHSWASGNVAAAGLLRKIIQRLHL